MSRPPIIDQFTNLPISKQLKWQRRKLASGLCPTCGEPKADGLDKCAKHSVKQREQQRKRNHAKKRYAGARSYKL